MKNSSILFITESDDAHVNLVESTLKEKGVEIARINTDIINESNFFYGSNTSIIWECIPKKVKTVWYRSRTKNPNAGEDVVKIFSSLETEGLIESIFAKLYHARWINRPDLLMLAKPKITQLERAQKHGLLIPETIVSNNTNTLTQFYTNHKGAVIVKPLKIQVIFLEKESLVFGTRSVSKNDINGLATEAPCYMQEKLDIMSEIRVIIFGDELHAFKMDSNLRYEDIKQLQLHEISHSTFILDKNTQRALRALVKSYGLEFTACDLILTKSGKLVFLELNPNGQWLWLQHMTNYQLLEPFIEFLIR